MCCDHADTNIQEWDLSLPASFWDCDAFYIGKTKRRLHDKKTEHFKALTQIGHYREYE